ncbi:hypothetical protein [Streptomyces sp. SID1034]|nr:hypothetical protein [Streptomyces sp. SID1034]
MYRLLAAVALITATVVAAAPADSCDRFPRDSYAYAGCEAQHHWS